MWLQGAEKYRQRERRKNSEGEEPGSFHTRCIFPTEQYRLMKNHDHKPMAGEAGSVTKIWVSKGTWTISIMFSSFKLLLPHERLLKKSVTSVRRGFLPFCQKGSGYTVVKSDAIKR